MPADDHLVRPLLDYLGREPAASEHDWQRWHIRPVPSGNNRLYRATGAEADWVVKFAIRDERDRVRREFNSLTLLERLGARVAPQPIFCDPDSYAQPVVVQTWVTGTAVWSPPDDDASWLKILQAYRQVHQITPELAEQHGIRPGPLLGPFAPDEQVARLSEYARQIPPDGQSARLAELMAALQRARFPHLPQTRCWAHGDPNVRNILLTANGARLVDWEYSGITDPANEIAKLMSHALAAAAGEGRFQWLAEHYAALADEAGLLPRIQLQYAFCLAWWCARLLFGYYVLLQQPSRRLVGHGPEAEISTLENIDRYFERALRQLAVVTSYP